MHRLIFALLLVLPFLSAAPAEAVEDVQPARVAGTTRSDTAAQIARLAYPQGVRTAVVATTVDFADALTGSGLAGSLVGAQLLVQPDDVPDPTEAALADLGVERVIIVGGPEAVSGDVEIELASSYEVTRIFGETPAQTAAQVGEEIVASTGIPFIDGRRSVFVANEERFADAIAGSVGAYHAGAPILYVEQGTLPPATAEFIERHQVEHAILLGGQQAISDAVAAEIEARGAVTTRIAGPSRVETSLELATYYFRVFGFELDQPLFARGDDFPDAVTVGQFGGSAMQPAILSATPTVMPESALNWIRTRCPVITVVRAVGGTEAVTTGLLEEVEQAAESCGEPGPGDGTRQTYIVAPQQAQHGDAPATFDFSVIGRYDEQPFTEPLDIVMFPCENADVVGSGDDTFADADDDDAADGFGTTDTGNARIAVVNGEDIEDTTVVVAAEPQDGQLTFRLASSAPDCTVPVAVLGDGDGELDLDSQNRPIEQYGVGFAEWTG